LPEKNEDIPEQKLGGRGKNNMEKRKKKDLEP
jgi:hypothetical protein